MKCSDTKYNNRVGMTSVMNNGLVATIIAYKNNKNIDVRFDNGQIVINRPYHNFNDGKISCPMIVENHGSYCRITNPNVENEFSFLIDYDDLKLIVHKYVYINTYGYPCVKINRKNLLLHRLVMNEPADLEIDHVNGDKLDLRKINLRKCTRMQNSDNIGHRSNNTSGFKGVIWDKRNKKWKSIIGHNNKQIYLGRFENKEDAATAYNEAATKYHGEFAKLNIIIGQSGKEKEIHAQE